MQRRACLRAETECDHLCNDIDALKRRLQECQDRIGTLEAQQGCSTQPHEEALLKGTGVQPLLHDTDTVAQCSNALRVKTGQLPCCCLCICIFIHRAYTPGIHTRSTFSHDSV